MCACIGVCVFTVYRLPLPPPGSMCLSAITWSGFDNFTFLFSYADTRDAFAMPYDIAIMEAVFACKDGSYNHKNSFWTATSLRDVIAGESWVCVCAVWRACGSVLCVCARARGCVSFRRVSCVCACVLYHFIRACVCAPLSACACACACVCIVQSRVVSCVCLRHPTAAGEEESRVSEWRERIARLRTEYDALSTHVQENKTGAIPLD
ncbi:MAG: hypothetical protein P4L40_12805 [Terracidiphilus sp.]|nr:hypothetical protein [Terracidiphilus sp.]